jgi:hypothetical protein
VLEVESPIEPPVEPIYINSMFIPQWGARDTQFGEHFYFSGLSNGLYSLKVFLDEQIVAASNVFVDEGAVSVVEFSADRLQRSQRFYIQAFDAFTGQLVPSKIELQNRLEPIQINGEVDVDQPVSEAHWVGARAFPNDSRYSPVETSYLASEEQLIFPLVSRSWIDRLRQVKGLERSLAIGFLPSENKPFIVFVSGAESEVVFFNEKGEILDKKEASREAENDINPHVSPQGSVGFFVVGPSAEGQIQVTISPVDSDLVYSQIVFLNPDFLQVLQPFKSSL